MSGRGTGVVAQSPPRSPSHSSPSSGNSGSSGASTTAVACRDDRVPFGACGCDKRHPPHCCLSFCCAPCVLTNYEGCSVLAIFSWMPCFTWIFAFYASCCWNPQLLGVHYRGRGKAAAAMHQTHKYAPAVVGEPVAGTKGVSAGGEYGGKGMNEGYYYTS